MSDAVVNFDALSADPRQRVLAGPMSPFQVVAVVMSVALCVLDGIDVMAITFAAPAIAKEWHVNKGALGLVLGAGLLGMAAGSLFIAPAADILGRRRLIFASLLTIIVGTFWTAVTREVGGLLVSRLITGVGIGAMISVINPLTAEYANARRRDLSVSMGNVGLPAGAVIGGFMAAFLLPAFGWRSIFVFAGVIGLIMLPAAWLWLPEPISLIIARPRGDSLAKVNAYLKRCRLVEVARLPPPPTDVSAIPIANLFRDGMAGMTLQLTAIYFLYMMTMFYVQTWLPSLVTSAGFTPSQGALVSASANTAGLVGGISFGAATLRFGLKRLAVGAFFCAALLAAAFGLLKPTFILILVGAAVTGFFLLGSAAMSLYAVISRTFPAHMRASGTGLVVGVGRVGAAIAPAVGGLLFAHGLSRGGVGMVMAGPALVSAILLVMFKVRPPTVA